MAEAAGDSRSLLLTGVGNARELGGYATEDGRTVKHDVLLRTAKLTDATEDDIQRLLTVTAWLWMWISAATARWRKRRIRRWKAWNT